MKSMIKGFRLLIIVALLLVVIPSTIAIQNAGNIKLLAVYHEGNKFSGSPADLQLEIKPGDGRVFIETIPLSKVDTQISTRFAKQIACKFAEVDCRQYDFFYTIKSAAGIVGGPSAGSAIAVLTATMLMDLNLKEDVTISGTINSGELIGPVGSLKEKIDAAKMSGINTVMIPAVQQELEDSNVTSLVDYGKSLGVVVVPVNTLSEAMSTITGEEFFEEDRDIEIPESYMKIMKQVSDVLCDKAHELINESSVFDLTQEKEVFLENVKSIQEAKNLTKKSTIAYEEGNYYSRASYCFGANLLARKVLYEEQNLDEEQLQEEIKNILHDVEVLDRNTEQQEKKTLTDLQTYMIVKERILEAKKVLESGENDSAKLAYTKERLFSAESWSSFFNNGGEEYDLDARNMKITCENTLEEVEERFQYLNLFFPGLLVDLRKNLLTAHEYYQQEEYALCIFLASRTKAEANILVTLLGVKEDNLGLLLEQKLGVAKRAITKQIDKGTFPILAYSYYEYGSSLKEENRISALLYAEYALELSDLSVYFESESIKIDKYINLRDVMWKVVPIFLFVWGVLLGYLYAWAKGKERKEKKAIKKIEQGKVRPKPKMEQTTRTKIRLKG